MMVDASSFDRSSFTTARARECGDEERSSHPSFDRSFRAKGRSNAPRA